MNADAASRPRLVAVVVTHERLDKLRVTLDRLLAAPAADLAAVVVIDNASADGTGSWLAGQRDPRLMVHRSPRNLGGAGGFETGMRLAVDRFDPDWIVVMDDDAYPQPGALAAFHDLDKTGWDALAAAVFYPDGEICGMNRPARNPFWHLPALRRTLLGGGRSGFHLTPEDYRGGVQAVDAASFVGLFVSRAGIARAGYPDGRLFIYGDDGLFTLGLRRNGGRIGFAPAVRFTHDPSTFQDAEEPAHHGQGGTFTPLWKLYYYHRNLLLIYRLATGWLFWPGLLVVLPKWGLKIRHHRGDRAAFVRLMGRAVSDGLRRRVDVSHAEVLRLAGDRPETAGTSRSTP